MNFSDPFLLCLQLIEAARVEDNIWTVNKSVTLRSKLELCEADIIWWNFFSNLKAVYFMIKHSCRMKQFQLLNLLFILKLQNCGRNKNMLKGNSISRK